MLVALEEAQRAAGMNEPDAFHRGAGEIRVRATLDGVFDRYSVDLLTWFMWHDGSTNHAPTIAPSAYRLLPLDEAVAMRAGLLEDAKDLVEGTDARPEHYWEPRWLPLAWSDFGGAMAVDAGPTHLGTGRVRFVEWSDTDFRNTGTPSLADLVAGWLLLMTEVEFRWNASYRTFDWDWQSVPVERRRQLGTG